MLNLDRCRSSNTNTKSLFATIAGASTNKASSYWCNADRFIPVDDVDIIVVAGPPIFLKLFLGYDPANEA